MFLNAEAQSCSAWGYGEFASSIMVKCVLVFAVVGSSVWKEDVAYFYVIFLKKMQS